jgi:hypothetical protein
MTKDNEPTPNQDNEKNKQGFTFVSHNFEAMNKAIDTEVEKRFEITELYQYQQTSYISSHHIKLVCYCTHGSHHLLAALSEQWQFYSTLGT